MTTKISHKDAIFYEGPVSQYAVISGGAPHTNAGKGAWAPTFWWNNKSTAPTFDALMDHTLHYYPSNDNSKLRVVTCYRNTEVDKKDLAAFGHIPYWEDQAEYFLRWTAEKPVLTTGHKPQTTDGIIVNGPEEMQKYSKFSTMTDISVPMRPMRIYGNIANNDFGKMISQAATAEHLFRKYLVSDRPNYVPGIGYVPFTDRSMEWREALSSEGFDEKRELKGIGAGDLGKMHAHAVTIYRRHIALSNELTSEAWRLAYSKGYRGRSAQEFADTYIGNIIEHEMAHVKEEEGLSESDSEHNIRSMHGRVNAKRAASRHNTLQGKIYGVLSRHWYATAEEFDSGRAGKAMSRLEAIAEEAVQEAEDMGLGKEEAVAYVSSKISRYAGHSRHDEEEHENDALEDRLESAINKSAADREDNPNDNGGNYESNKMEASGTADNAEPANDAAAQESQAA